MRKPKSLIRSGYWCYIVGAATLTCVLALQFVGFGETCCGMVDYISMRDLIGGAECSKVAFARPRIAAWFALVVGVAAMLYSLIDMLVLRDRT